jgi:uncharacterized protein
MKSTEHELQALKQMAENGHTKAQINLGWKQFLGRAGGESEGDAERWLRIAAATEDPEAQYFLSEYLRRSGFEVAAFAEARKSAKQGYLPALCALGSCYNYGCGTAENPPLAKIFIEAAAGGGHLYARTSHINMSFPRKNVIDKLVRTILKSYVFLIGLLVLARDPHDDRLK